MHLGDAVLVEVDRDARAVRTATAATRFPTTRWCWPPARRRSCRRCPGSDLPGCFVYRTLDDLDAIRGRRDARAGARPAIGVVVGGGLLGLEAANALRLLGLSPHVVEFAPRLMPVQVDEGGGALLRRLIEELGVAVRTGVVHHGGRRRDRGRLLVRAVRRRRAGRRRRRVLRRHPPARPAGPRCRAGGRASAAASRRRRLPDQRSTHVCAVGECACVEGRSYGLVAPGYAMAEVVADRLLGGAARVRRRRHVHQAQAARRRRGELRRRARRHRGRAGGRRQRPGRRAPTRSSSSPTTRRTLLGGVLVGDAVEYARAAPAGRPAAARRPAGADRAAGGWRGGRDRRAARRRADLLLQRRHQGRRSAGAIARPGCARRRRR